MSRMVAFFCVFSLSSIAHAELPAAPLNASTAQEIANEFRECCEYDYKYDVSRVSRMSGIPGSEQAYVYAKYMNEAFERVGYSMDKTLLSYYKSERNYPVVAFMSKLNLESYAVSLKGEVGGAFEKAGAVSAATISYARDIAWEIPISNADYIIEADPGYFVGSEEASKGFRRDKVRMIGYVKRGTGPWRECLYLDNVSSPGESNGVGLVSDSDDAVGVAERGVWDALVGKKVKVEGVYFRASGMTVGTPENGQTVRDPAFFDKKYPIVFKLL